jgi:guanylate kinase
MSSNAAPLSRRGLMLVISSPSGAGKSSLSRRLIAEHARLELSVSCTTRRPRPGETDGVEYHFVTQERFAELVAGNAFLEWANVHDHRYGTLRAPVMAALEAGRDVLFDIDWQGGRQIIAQAKDDVVLVFILPPSLSALRDRLQGRAQDSAEVIERRLTRATEEIAHYDEYDYVIVNDQFEQAYHALLQIYQGEQLRRHRHPGLEAFVTELMAGQA